jgi:hypothetical protein
VRPKLDLAGVKAVTLSEYAARFAFGGAVSIVTMLVTRAYGPVIGGLFLAFPSIFPAAITLVRHHDGRAKAVDDARGARIGSAGMVAFALVVWATARVWPPGATLAAGVAAWFIANFALWACRYAREPQPVD